MSLTYGQDLDCVFINVYSAPSTGPSSWWEYGVHWLIYERNYDARTEGVLKVSQKRLSIPFLPILWLPLLRTGGMFSIACLPHGHV